MYDRVFFPADSRQSEATVALNSSIRFVREARGNLGKGRSKSAGKGTCFVDACT